MRFTSPILSQARGSVGGLCFTGNQFHNLVAKIRTGPKRIMTNLQVAIRTSMNAAQAVWLSLDQEDKDAWDAYAAFLTFTGPLGTYHISGRACFIRSYVLATYMNNVYSAGITENWEWDGPVAVGGPNIGPILPLSFVGAGATGIAFDVVNNSGFDAVCFYELSAAFTASRVKAPSVWDTTLSGVEDVPDGATTTISVSGLRPASYYFVRARMITDYNSAQPPLTANVSILRILSVTNP